MGVSAYGGVDRSEIEKARLTSDGQRYTLNHKEELVIDMRFKGAAGSGVNSQGWERNQSYYFRQLQSAHPEYFDRTNTTRIANGQAPSVNKQFLEHFPEYGDFKNQNLIHHHIGKDGQAVALPTGAHRGSGEIHNHENGLGITANAERFSAACAKECDLRPEHMGKTAGELQTVLAARQAKAGGFNGQAQGQSSGAGAAAVKAVTREQGGRQR
ncbi:MAG: hypothetical protein LBK56_09575 [Gracilibacteraceae bacterium]|jgi:hypothetical protein|nr:hypothetical protein [Gracilibacteraceae bacterium]